MAPTNRWLKGEPLPQPQAPKPLSPAFAGREELLKAMEDPEATTTRSDGRTWKWMGCYIYDTADNMVRSGQLGHSPGDGEPPVAVSIRAAIWMNLLPTDRNGRRFSCDSPPIRSYPLK